MWEAPTADDVQSEFTPTEVATINNLLSGSINIETRLNMVLRRTVLEIRGYIRSGDYPLDLTSTATVPQSMLTDAVALTRWRFLISAPQLKQLQTEERRQSFEDSVAKLKAIAAQNYTPDAPTAVDIIQGGMWNSECKLIMRTHPVTPPSTQFQPQPGIPAYANPNAPPDAP